MIGVVGSGYSGDLVEELTCELSTERNNYGKIEGDAFQAEGMSFACPDSLIN